MTAPDDIDEGSQPIEIRAGRRAAPHTDINDWVVLAAIDAEAVVVYLLLRMHELAGQPVDTDRLASIMGRDADRVQQLRAIGAVSVARQDGRDIYQTHDEPPPGYTGPMTLADRLAGDR